MRTDPTLAPVLSERARRLARPMSDGAAGGASDGLLQFQVGGELLAIATDAVAEAQEAPLPAPLPGMPPWLAGMVGIRGRILPAIWLDRFLAASPASGASGEADRAVVLDVDGVQLALMTSAIDGIASAPDGPLDELPAGLSPVAQQCAAGIHRRRLVLDAPTLVGAMRAALGSSAPDAGEPPHDTATQGESHAPRT